MMKISAVIITLNEERNIERCLKSLLPVADEIVVVDSFSEDKTKEICLKHQVRFIEHAFEGHIQQKNFAMQQASNDLVLSLDADEQLSDELQANILKVKNQHKAAAAYAMNRLTNYCGKWIHHCGWYPDTKLRLWDRRKGKWGGTNPHDQVIMDKGAEVRHLKGDLLHFSFYTIAEHIQQINNFTSISAEAMKSKNKTVVLLKMIFSPGIRFLRDFILKGGFRDGFYGFVICKNAAYSRFLRYAKLYQLTLKQ